MGCLRQPISPRLFLHADLLLVHPGLEFLKQTPEFQEKYGIPAFYPYSFVWKLSVGWESKSETPSEKVTNKFPSFCPLT